MKTIRHINDLKKFNSAIYIDGNPNGGYAIPSKAELRDASKLIELYGHLKIKSFGPMHKPDTVDNEVMTHYVTFEDGPCFLLG